MANNSVIHCCFSDRNRVYDSRRNWEFRCNDDYRVVRYWCAKRNSRCVDLALSPVLLHHSVLIGIVFFFKNIGSTFDQRYSGIPKQLATEIAHKIVVVLLYFSGIMLVLSATIPQAFTEFRWLHSLNPLKFHFIIQFPSILLGFLLIIMGRGIAARVKRAYLPTIFLIVLALLYVLLSDFSFTPVVFLSILLLIILASKTNYFGNN